MQQLGCESHSVTCVSCYVHVYGNKVIIIIIIIKVENNWVRNVARVTRADRRRMAELREEQGCRGA